MHRVFIKIHSWLLMQQMEGHAISWLQQHNPTQQHLVILQLLQLLDTQYQLQWHLHHHMHQQGMLLGENMLLNLTSDTVLGQSQAMGQQCTEVDTKGLHLIKEKSDDTGKGVPFLQFFHTDGWNIVAIFQYADTSWKAAVFIWNMWCGALNLGFCPTTAVQSIFTRQIQVWSYFFLGPALTHLCIPIFLNIF